MGITVNVTGDSAVSVTVDGSTSVAVVASGGIGPAGFVTTSGTATSGFGTIPIEPGVGITVSTAAGSFRISSYDTATIRSLSSVASVSGRTGTIVLQAADITAGTFPHTRLPVISYTSLSDVPTLFTPQPHSHVASHITAGVFDIARIPTIGYTALSGVPLTFAPSTHTHATTDISGLTAAAAAAAPVQSVLGRTGNVSFTRLDLTAAASTHSHNVSDIPNFTNVANVVSVFGITGDVQITGSGLVNVSRTGNTINIGAASSTATAVVVAAVWPAIVFGG